MHIDYELIDQEQTGLGLLELRRYLAETGESGYEIVIDGAFLMATHGCHSERAMARIAWERLPEPKAGLQTLIGGLGAGHTLRATLDLGGVESVVVAEIGRKVVEWNRQYFADANGNAVRDPRVRVEIGDVLNLVGSAKGCWHLILLDVDNGPGWLASPSNAHLYSVEGLERCRNALRPDGVLAIWSPDRNNELAARLSEVFPKGFEAIRTDEIARHAHEPPSVIYCARNTSDRGI